MLVVYISFYVGFKGKSVLEYTVRPPLYAVVGGTGFFAKKPRAQHVFFCRALLSRTKKDIHKISFACDHTSFPMCRKLCEKFLGGHGHVTLVTRLALTIIKYVENEEKRKYLLSFWGSKAEI